MVFAVTYQHNVPCDLRFTYNTLAYRPARARDSNNDNCYINISLLTNIHIEKQCCHNNLSGNFIMLLQIVLVV